MLWAASYLAHNTRQDLKRAAAQEEVANDPIGIRDPETLRASRVEVIRYWVRQDGQMFQSVQAMVNQAHLRRIKEWVESDPVLIEALVDMLPRNKPWPLRAIGQFASKGSNWVGPIVVAIVTFLKGTHL